MITESNRINSQNFCQASTWSAVSGNNCYNKRFYLSSKVNKSEDLSNNGNFDRSEASKNFFNGVKGPFREVFNFAQKNPTHFAVITVASIGLTALSTAFPPVGFALTGIGCYFIGKPLIKGVKQLNEAKNGDDKEKAFANFGESATYTLLTFGTNMLTKILPNSTLNKSLHAVHKSGKHTIGFFSNATDVVSFAPTVKAGLIIAGKGLIGSEVSYNTRKEFG